MKAMTAPQNSIIMIPARLESSRLPGKALLNICNVPMIVHVALRCKRSALVSRVIVCTDSVEICRRCNAFGIEVCLTRQDSVNGTERIADACERLQLESSDLIIDVQGDEPLVDPNFIDQVISFHGKHQFDCTVPHILMNELDNENRVKLIASGSRVLYMTRADSPVYFGGIQKHLKKHLSVIAFEVGCLSAYASLTVGELEAAERIELLRLIEHGWSVGTFEVSGETLAVDTRADYEKVCRMMERDPLYQDMKVSGDI